MAIRTLRELVQQLGGAGETARLLSAHSDRGISGKAVYKWLERGALPPRWVLPAQKAARELGLEIPAELLLQLATPDGGRQTKAA